MEVLTPQVPLSSLMLSIANAIVQVEFPDRMNSLISLQTAFTGLGTLFGPIIGSYLFLWGGFKCPFYVLGSSLLVLMVVL